MQKDIVPFGQWMLEPLKFNNEELEIYPDPWNATRERSYSVIYDELQTMANEQYQSTNTSIIVESERLSSRRIYLPTYIVEYKILGITYIKTNILIATPSIYTSNKSKTQIDTYIKTSNSINTGTSIHVLLILT